MADVQRAYNANSPYQDTQVLTWIPHQQLVQLGYISHSVNKDQAELCRKLSLTVEGIKTFFWERFKIVGIGNHGPLPPLFVHLQEENAYYCPKKESSEHFAFNDKFAGYPEVVAHEFTHGIIEHINPLGNEGESGAINESIADVVGIVYKKSRYATATDDWWIADLHDLSKGGEVKLEPTNSTNDNGNTHHNSLVLSYAFYLASSNLSRFDHGDVRLLQIWFLSVLTLEQKTFKGFKAKTIQVATEFEKPFESAIVNAWDQVDLTVPDPNPKKKKSPTSKKTNPPPQRAPQTQINLGFWMLCVAVVIVLVVLVFRGSRV